MKDYIKIADKSDIEIVAALAIGLWTEHSLQDLINEYAELIPDADARVFIKYVNCEPIGFAQCQLRRDYVEGTSSSPVGYLEGIYIKPQFRRNGYSKELLTECEVWSKNKGCKEFASDCELENDLSLRFHLASGFREVNRIICFKKSIV